jgi:hypothetical protein
MANEVLKFSRVLHLYFGVLIAPAILFFALTGALQTFGLHETNRDHPDYKPAHWIVVLGQLHKKQTVIVPVRKAPPVAADAGKGKHDVVVTTPPQAPPAVAAPQRHPLPLRIFFLIVCIGLFSSTLTGLLMAYRYTRNKGLVTAVLVVGIVLPLVLIFV